MKNDITTVAQQHTPEPWKTDWHFIVAADPKGIYPDIYIGEIAEEDSSEPPRIASREEQIANGCRIVAAVNACKGIPTEALEQGIVGELVEMLELAINQLEEWLVGFPKNTDDTPEIVEILRVTLGKVKGAKPEKDTGDAGHDPATTTPQALLTDFIARISAVNSDLLAHGISVMRYELEHRPDADHIFAVWHVEDVRNRRPDLTREACREVLREMNRHLDAEKGINWNVIDAVAALYYPAPANLDELRENAEN